MKRNSDNKKMTELETALCEWRSALRRFDVADGEEVRCAALEVEAARQRYMLILNKQRGENEVRRFRALQE